MPAKLPSRVLLARASSDLHGADLAGARPPAPDAGVDAPGLAGADTGRGEVVIDLTGSAPRVRPAAPAATAHAARSRDLWRMMLAAVALLTMVLAIANYATGMRWRAQALAAQDRAARAADDAATQQEAVVLAQRERNRAELRREAIAKQLTVSEADVAALEARVEALASDKARGEDYGEYQELSDSSAVLRALEAQLDSCVAQVDALRVGLRDPAADATIWRGAANAAHVACEQASADAASLNAERR